ncbi:gustatory receptor for sugar taste 61a-like [Uranotaenia lowii]|uniref:gustatory receptor for sugar taste 61a-like n=1 Tax=Uranotaenia lowii TaxID=190385 RepID=UPI00247A1889|nr:gustatory receptor for sugar taste 61a-like [Uranotaenia lowii]
MFNTFQRQKNVLEIKKRKIHSDFGNSSSKDGTVTADRFHQAIAPIILVIQIFGIFPLGNVMARNPGDYKFGRLHLCYWISAIAIFGGYALATLSINRVWSKLNVFNIDEALFFGINATCSVITWKIAREWKFLTTRWYHTEELFLTDAFVRVSLKWKIRLLAVTILLLALAEHSMCVLSNILSLYKVAWNCKWDIPDHFHFYSSANFQSVFKVFPYNVPMAIYNQYVIISMTFTWNFVDLFIILVSIGIHARFHQLNIFIESRIHRKQDEQFWEQIRILYTTLCELMDVLNTHISKLMFISFGNDLYVLCKQISNANAHLPFFINKLYFLYSFTFLLLRTFLMFWYCSKVHDVSQEPFQLIEKVSSDDFCEELRRIQMYSKKGVGFSGLGLFRVTRQILLSVAGTIVTYELVMAMYRRRSPVFEFEPNCDMPKLV